VVIYWLVVGALIGALAAQRRGFSVIGGLLGGAILGFLSPLMFFVDGIVSSSEKQVKCAHCAEWIKREAKVCKHCHRDVDPQPALGIKTCPECGAVAGVQRQICRECGASFASSVQGSSV
jgi:predicted RNA-binding Zn-ribbon protein involved in translation (DUF1610 family)